MFCNDVKVPGCHCVSHNFSAVRVDVNCELTSLTSIEECRRAGTPFLCTFEQEQHSRSYLSFGGERWRSSYHVILRE